MAKSDMQIQQESDKKIAAAKKRALPENQHSKNGVADWWQADPALIAGLICLITTEGGAVRFGYTRDGGAYSIGLYLGDDSKTYYCNDAEGINEQLKDLAEHFRK